MLDMQLIFPLIFVYLKISSTRSKYSVYYLLHFTHGSKHTIDFTILLTNAIKNTHMDATIQ